MDAITSQIVYLYTLVDNNILKEYSIPIEIIFVSFIIFIMILAFASIPITMVFMVEKMHSILVLSERSDTVADASN